MSRNSRIKCAECNNLDPQNHRQSVYNDTPDIRKRSVKPKRDVNLSLSLDPLKLSRIDQKGCRHCQLLAKALDAYVPDWRRKRPALTLEIAWAKPVRVSVGVFRGKPRIIELYNKAATKPPWPSLGAAIELPSNSDSDETYEFAIRCLEECSTNPQHELCSSSQKIYLPTRLLKISEPGKPVKLQQKSIFSSLFTPVQYVALSHCWGEEVPITTSKDTLNSRCKGIDWDELPPLFQDTIKIAYRLGIKYVWIDSLCILQDDRSDWENESSKMATVYADAFVTVAAVQALDSQERCLGPRPKPIKLKYENTKGDEYFIRSREIFEHHPRLSSSKPAKVEGPLVHRAWALQEHVLCSRVLHYTKTEVIFECRNMYACECSPRFKQTCVTTPALLPSISSNTNREKQFAIWHHLVEGFTLRKLTRASDKLPAISGMAQKMQEIVESDYLAGMWRKNLIHDIQWSSAVDLQNPMQATIFDQYRAPSWSWASLDTQIRYETTPGQSKSRVSTQNIVAKITAAQVELASLTFPLGEIKSGFLTISGPVVLGTLIGPAEITFFYKLKISNYPPADVYPDSILVVEESMPHGQNETPASATVRRAKENEQYRSFKCNVTCIGIKDDTEDGIITGLVLSEIPNSTNFQRVGLFSCGRELFRDAVKKKLTIV